MIRPYIRFLLPVAALALAACQPQTPPADTAKPAPAAQAAPSPSPAPAAASTSDTPALRIATLDGKTFDLAEHRGRWVLINFWATWCGPCIKEMPELSALDAMREHIEVIGLAYEEIEPADMRAFLKEHPVSYPIALVDVASPPPAFDTPRGLPMSYLIAPDGKVAEKFLGPVDAKKIEEAIARAGGPKPGEAPAAPKPGEKSAAAAAPQAGRAGGPSGGDT